MQMRPLGQSNISASAVGFGAWTIGGWMWGGASEDESIRAIHAALDAGINLIDTAPIYGFGLSEVVVGKALKDRRDKAVLATKCGMVCNTRAGRHMFNSNAAGPDERGHIAVHIHLSPESIRREVEASLTRLRTDHIDLYQTHWQEETTPIEQTMRCLLDLKKEGKIRAIGVSNCTGAQMEEYRRIGPVDADQEKFSMLARDINADQAPYCREHNIAILAYSPLAQGLLTGKVGPERTFAEGDMRNNDWRFSKANRQRVASMLDVFRPITDRHGCTLAQLATAWTVAQPGVTHALCGARTPDQARENAVGGGIELNPDDLATMDKAVSACELRKD